MSEDSEVDSDEEVPTDVTAEAEPSTIGVFTSTATATLAFSADNIRERLDDDEYVLALILTSTRLENILARGIKAKLDLDDEEFESLWGNKTLGRYAHICDTLGVYGEDFDKEVIDNVADLRNNLVHDYGYLDTLQEDQEEMQNAENVIDDAIEFIEGVEMQRPSTRSN